MVAVGGQLKTKNDPVVHATRKQVESGRQQKEKKNRTQWKRSHKKTPGCFLQAPLSHSDARCQDCSPGTTVRLQCIQIHTRIHTQRDLCCCMWLIAHNPFFAERTVFCFFFKCPILPERGRRISGPPMVLFLLDETRLRGRSEKRSLQIGSVSLAENKRHREAHKAPTMTRNGRSMQNGSVWLPI